jgi:hypothetical protein
MSGKMICRVQGEVDGSEGEVDGSEGEVDGSEGEVDGSEGEVDGSEGEVDGSEGEVDCRVQGAVDGGEGEVDCRVRWSSSRLCGLWRLVFLKAVRVAAVGHNYQVMLAGGELVGAPDPWN